jgi:peptidoglycan/LPS O-acetylase OafA/YrhL
MGDHQGAPRRVEAIDGLRGIAALSVAWFHLYSQNGGVPLADAMPAAMNLASVWGRFGVQLFFAISGFVVAYTLLLDRSFGHVRDIGAYFIRRSIRLDPTYWLALAAYVIGVPLIVKLGGPADVFPPQRLDVPEIAANVLYFLPLNILLYVPVAWSLVVEIQFYLFFALLVLALNQFATARFSGLAACSCWRLHRSCSGAARRNPISTTISISFSAAFSPLHRFCVCLALCSCGDCTLRRCSQRSFCFEALTCWRA